MQLKKSFDGVGEMATTTTTRKVYNMFERRHAIPIIYVRGTHYDVGYDVVSILKVKLFLLRRFLWWTSARERERDKKKDARDFFVGRIFLIIEMCEKIG